MKKNHLLLIAGIAFYGMIAGSCTKDNTQPDSYTKKSGAVAPSNNTSQAATSQAPATPPPSETVSSGGCSHQH
jgi:hypothetical protein